MSDAPPPPPPPPPPPSFGAPTPGSGAGGTPPLAEIGPRVIAFLIDRVAPGVGWWFGSIIFGAVARPLAALWFFVGGLGLLGFWIWQIMQEGSTGQTVGKKMQNIKLVGLENGGQPIGAVNVFLKLLINGLPCYLGWVLGFFDPQRQTLGDKVTKSVVVPA